MYFKTINASLGHLHFFIMSINLYKWETIFFLKKEIRFLWFFFTESWYNQTIGHAWWKCFLFEWWSQEPLVFSFIPLIDACWAEWECANAYLLNERRDIDFYCSRGKPSCVPVFTLSIHSAELASVLSKCFLSLKFLFQFNTCILIFFQYSLNVYILIFMHSVKYVSTSLYIDKWKKIFHGGKISIYSTAF